MEKADINKTLLMYDDIAKRLLQDQYLLTALELHLELVEAGQELPRLRDFFSCPSNFELCSKSTDLASVGMNRSLSQTTLDSMDWARYSEDGERLFDDRVAVLEFELRKAKETIQSLRNNLTEAMEDQSVAENKISYCTNEVEELKPHQIAMLNFLINEYLFCRGYKMTAITFADENDNQDFDNWDDVGLNIPRPRSLQQWWHEKAAQIAPRIDACCQTEEISDGDSKPGFEPTEPRTVELQEPCKLQFDNDLQCSRAATSSTPAVTPAKLPPKEISFSEDLSFYSVHTSVEDVVLDPADDPYSTQQISEPLFDSEAFFPKEKAMYAQNAANMPESDESFLPATLGLNPFDEAVPVEDQNNTEDTNDVTGSTLREGVQQLVRDDEQPVETEADGENIDFSNCDRLSPLGAGCEWTSNNTLCGEFSSAQKQEAKNLLSESTSRSVPAPLENELLRVCLSETLGTASHLQKEIAAYNLGECDLVNILCQSLHNIAPNIILSKREELLPLLVYCISQQTNIKEREKLLHLLFNLTKKPNRTQRSTILLGLVSLARVMGSSCLEAEILPQCWEQLSHKHPERRVLVAQSVGVLAPYTPTHIRNSLLLSMLQQILSAGEESDPRVINAAMGSLSLLIAYLNDEEKLSKLIQTVMTCIECDLAKKYIDLSYSGEEAASSKHLLYTTLAQCCLDFDVLQHLITEQTQRLRNLVDEIVRCSEANAKANVEMAKNKLRCSSKHLVTSVPYIAAMLHASIPQREDHPPLISLPSGFVDDLAPVLSNREQSELAISQLYYAYTSCTRWKELNFLLNDFFPSVIDILANLEAENVNVVKEFSDLITYMCFLLGPTLISSSAKPLFTKILYAEETHINTVYMNKALLVVYVLSLVAEQSPHRNEDLAAVVIELVCLIADTSCSIVGLETALDLLLEKHKYEETILEALWSCVVHSSAAVKISSAPLWTLMVGRIHESAVASRVVPALVTLATDSDSSVRASALMPLSNILSRSPSRQVCDKVNLQLEILCEEDQVLESVDLQSAIINTCISLGHNTPPQVLHNVFLPCICRATLDGRGSPEQRLKFSTNTLEAFKALISASIPNHVVAHFILPVLNQFQKTLGSISVEYMEEISSLTKEYTVRLQMSPSADRSRSIGHSASFTSAIGSGLPLGRQGVEDVKNTMSKIGRVVSSGVQNKASINLPNLFKRKQ